jgi:hypothetical protein
MAHRLTQSSSLSLVATIVSEVRHWCTAFVIPIYQSMIQILYVRTLITPSHSPGPSTCSHLDYFIHLLTHFSDHFIDTSGSTTATPLIYEPMSKCPQAVLSWSQCREPRKDLYDLSIANRLGYDHLSYRDTSAVHARSTLLITDIHYIGGL